MGALIKDLEVTLFEIVLLTLPVLILTFCFYLVKCAVFRFRMFAPKKLKPLTSVILVITVFS